MPSNGRFKQALVYRIPSASKFDAVLRHRWRSRKLWQNSLAIDAVQF
ncbi:MAG: hypothetical protein F6K28_60805 [Microcoleus sp. SIO2G3]|nr:hypothetical protein [Microcoleus sp. SIO2G3]